MAKVVSLRVGVSVTLNAGNYESTKLDAGIELALGPGDDVPKLHERYRLLLLQDLAKHAEIFCLPGTGLVSELLRVLNAEAEEAEG